LEWRNTCGFGEVDVIDLLSLALAKRFCVQLGWSKQNGRDKFRKSALFLKKTNEKEMKRKEEDGSWMKQTAGEVCVY
jgi:hypothetical protein